MCKGGGGFESGGGGFESRAGCDFGTISWRNVGAMVNAFDVRSYYRASIESPAVIEMYNRDG